MPNIFEVLKGGAQTEEELALRFLYPTKDPFKMLKMVAEQQPKNIASFSVLGVIQRRFKSEVLKQFVEEHAYNTIASNRLGRVEAGEITVGLRRLKESGMDKD